MCNNLLVLILFGMATQCLCISTYDIRLESFMAIEGEDETVVDYKKMKLVGRERALNGSAFFASDMNDEFTVSISLFTLVYGKWIQSPYEIKGMTSCDFGKNYFLKYADVKNINTNYPKTEAGYCPTRKGEYWMIKVIPNTDKWVSFMKRGLLKFHYEVLKNGKGVGGFEVEANVFDRLL